MTRARKAAPKFTKRSRGTRLLGARGFDRGSRLAPGQAGAPAQSAAEHDGDFAAPARQPAGGDQDRRPQARRALPVADQDVAQREGGVGRVERCVARRRGQWILGVYKARGGMPACDHRAEAYIGHRWPERRRHADLFDRQGEGQFVEAGRRGRCRRRGGDHPPREGRRLCRARRSSAPIDSRQAELVTQIVERAKSRRGSGRTRSTSFAAMRDGEL